MELINKRVKKKSSGLYLPEIMIKEVAEIAERNELSVNETMVQLLQVGIDSIQAKAKEDK